MNSTSGTSRSNTRTNPFNGAASLRNTL